MFLQKFSLILHLLLDSTFPDTSEVIAKFFYQCFYREKELTLSARNSKKRKYSKRVFNHPTSTTMKKAAKQHTNHYRAMLQKSGVEVVSVRAVEFLFLPEGGGCPHNHSSGSRSSTSSAANHIQKTLPASPQ